MKCKTCGQEIVETVIQKIPAKILTWGKTSEKELNWQDAKEWCEKQGDGWRLPTLMELQEAYADEKIRGSFQPYGYYWSSTEVDAYNAYGVYFNCGGSDGATKTTTDYYVRACK